MAVLAATAGLAASTRATVAQPGVCFRSSDWRGWKATRDGHTLYVGAGPQRVFRLELAQPCPELNDIDAKLVTRTHSGWVCQPSDLALQDLQPGGGALSSCRVRRMSRLYPSEVKALPKELRP
jgi:hypothetical protein